MAEDAQDPLARETILSIAAGYERLAQQAEERLAARKRDGGSRLWGLGTSQDH